MSKIIAQLRTIFREALQSCFIETERQCIYCFENSVLQVRQNRESESVFRPPPVLPGCYLAGDPLNLFDRALQWDIAVLGPVKCLQAGHQHDELVFRVELHAAPGAEVEVDTRPMSFANTQPLLEQGSEALADLREVCRTLVETR